MFGRRAFNQTKVILQADPAIDEERSDYTKYLENFDESHLSFLPGDKPTRFMIRQMDTDQKDALDALEGRAKLSTRIKMCLKGIENYNIFKPDGSSYPIANPEFNTRGLMGECIKDSWWKEFNPTEELIAALSTMCWFFSEAKAPLSNASAGGAGPPKSQSQMTSLNQATSHGTANTATNQSESATVAA